MTTEMAGKKPSPETLASRPGIRGTPAVLSDGQTWLLSEDIHDLSIGPWDRLYDLAVLKGIYEEEQLRFAAAYLLLENYALDAWAAWDLVWGVDLAALVAPVEAAMFGGSKNHRKWSEYCRMALLVNGIRPEDYSPAERRDMVQYLELHGKVVPRHKFISSNEARIKRARMRFDGDPARFPGG